MTVILIGFIPSSKVPSSLMSLFVEIYAILDYLTTIVCIHFIYADVFRQIVQRECIPPIFLRTNEHPLRNGINLHETIF